MMKRLTAAALVFLLMVGVLPAWAAAATKEVWNRESPYPTAQNLSSITYGDNQFVALGSNGELLTSPDGKDWTAKTTVGNNDVYLSAIAYGNGVYAAVGSSTMGNGAVLYTSVDGGNQWTKKSYAGYMVSFSDIVYAGGKFVAVGGVRDMGMISQGKSVVLTSSDGENWDKKEFGTKPLYGVAFNNNKFVAVGDKTIITSTDGTNWNSVSSTYTLIDITTDENMFIAVGEGGKVATSENGASWSAVVVDAPATFGNINYANGNYYINGYKYVGSNSVYVHYSSTNLTDWVSSTSPISDSYLLDMAYGNGVYVAVGNKGAVLTSEDGENWESVSSGIGEHLQNVVYHEGKYLAVGGYTSAVYSSADGKNWTSNPIADNKGAAINKIVYINGHYAAVSQYGQVLFSDDGETWTVNPLTSNSPPPISDIIYANDQYMVTDTYGRVYTSSDGTTWTSVNTGKSTSLFGLAYSGSVYAAVGEQKILSSTDGEIWDVSWELEQKPGQPINQLWVKGIVYAAGKFVAVGMKGTILTSGDGQTWVPSTSGVTAQLNGVKYLNGQFVAVGDKTVLTSPDGIVWTSVPGATEYFTDVAYDGSQYVLVGANGAVFTLKFVEDDGNGGNDGNSGNGNSGNGGNGSSGSGNPSGQDGPQKTIKGEMWNDLVRKNAVVEINTANATYRIPAPQLDLSKILKQLGNNVRLEDVSVNIEIAKPDDETQKRVETAAAESHFALVGQPIEFRITVTGGGSTVEANKFNVYVERSIELPEGIDPSKITTAVVVESDGSVRHVPTQVTISDGRYHARINSLTNSVYALVYHPVTFKDAERHWAKNSMNDMGSRMVVKGKEDGLFHPEQAITRAEFISIVARGLGLRTTDTSVSYADVTANAWYSGSVHAAHEYGLIKGDEKGMFRPEALMTREQAMVIIAQAMKLTGIQKDGANATAGKLQAFKDGEQVSQWAKDAVSACLQAGIVSGRSAKELAPKANLTRAEVAVIVQHLLQKSNLI
ncbi:hypothetical protein D7Z26_22040 [Cohnella endophytica]|uniref:SLH domain-containing protein n=1 Tax=Cohnella endophytica TaxID=2419778 RepID=A0A494XAQ2_9BACL|nr:S-layer homology domain-containing protein [Cohnella endophytica]RKP47897.1 hypothetical protein D7Z26_22040 [Cohnella endophytica]